MKKSLTIFIIGFIIYLNAFNQDSISFIEYQKFPNEGANDIAIADFDKDGDVDFVTANGLWNKPLPSKLWLNDGKGRFTDSKIQIGNAKSWSVSSCDVNGDNHLDILIANGDWNNGDSSEIWINSNLEFNNLGQRFNKSNTSCAEFGDLDNNGTIDVFFANHPLSDGTSGEDEIWLSDLNGKFKNSGQALGGNDAARRVKLADMDNDNDLDAVVLNGGSTNKIWINNGHGQFRDSKENIGSGENVDFTICDINNDSHLDIIIVKGAWDKTPKGIEVWQNDGTANFTLKQKSGINDGYGIASGDFNNDKYADLVVINGLDQQNQLFLNDGKGFFHETKINIGIGGNRVAVCDVNNDKLDDIIIIGPEYTTVFLRFSSNNTAIKNGYIK